MTRWQAALPPGAPGGQPRRRPRVLPAVLALAIVALGAVLAVRLTGGSTSPGCAAGRAQATFVPAFFEPPDWSRAVSEGPPAVMILNPASGPGTAPQPGLQQSVRHAAGAGTRVLGYVGTNYGQLPAAQARREIRQYRAWYRVHGIFLDLTPTQGTARLGYYRDLAAYIRGQIPGAVIWINPGSVPDRAYMSVASVAMIFEGSYAQYQHQAFPRWVRDYPARRFAHTIYGTPPGDITPAVRLSRQRNAGYLFLTPDAGANPYGTLPGYWPAEHAAATSSCTRR